MKTLVCIMTIVQKQKITVKREIFKILSLFIRNVQSPICLHSRDVFLTCLAICCHFNKEFQLLAFGKVINTNK